MIDESHQHAGHMGSREGGETHFRVRVTSRGLRRKEPGRPSPDDQCAARGRTRPRAASTLWRSRRGHPENEHAAGAARAGGLRAHRHSHAAAAPIEDGCGRQIESGTTEGFQRHVRHASRRHRCRGAHGAHAGADDPRHPRGHARGGARARRRADARAGCRPAGRARADRRSRHRRCPSSLRRCRGRARLHHASRDPGLRGARRPGPHRPRDRHDRARRGRSRRGSKRRGVTRRSCARAT